MGLALELLLQKTLLDKGEGDSSPSPFASLAEGWQNQIHLDIINFLGLFQMFIKIKYQITTECFSSFFM